MNRALFALACSAVLITACNRADSPSDIAEDKVEHDAEAAAAAAGPTPAALGLTEVQLLEADLVGGNGVELGDVKSLVRGPDGSVSQLLIEIEDSHPDKFVHVPVAGLQVVRKGNDTDLSTTMTREQLNALPSVDLTKTQGASGT